MICIGKQRSWLNLWTLVSLIDGWCTSLVAAFLNAPPTCFDECTAVYVVAINRRPQWTLWTPRNTTFPGWCGRIDTKRSFLVSICGVDVFASACCRLRSKRSGVKGRGWGRAGGQAVRRWNVRRIDPHSNWCSLCISDTHSRVCLKATDEEDFLRTYINANYMRVGILWIMFVCFNLVSNRITLPPPYYFFLKWLVKAMWWIDKVQVQYLAQTSNNSSIWDVNDTWSLTIIPHKHQ